MPGRAPYLDGLLGVLNEPNLDSHRCVPDGTDRSASHTQLTTIAQSEQETATPALIVSTPAHNQQSPMSDMVAPLRKTIRKRNKAHLNIRRSAAPPDLPSLTLRCPSSQICPAAIVGAKGQRRIHCAVMPRPSSTAASSRQRGCSVGCGRHPSFWRSSQTVQWAEARPQWSSFKRGPEPICEWNRNHIPLSPRPLEPPFSQLGRAPNFNPKPTSARSVARSKPEVQCPASHPRPIGEGRIASQRLSNVTAKPSSACSSSQGPPLHCHSAEPLATFLPLSALPQPSAIGPHPS